LFTEHKVEFAIDRPAIKELHINGLIKWDENGHVIFLELTSINSLINTKNTSNSAAFDLTGKKTKTAISNLSKKPR